MLVDKLQFICHTEHMRRFLHILFIIVVLLAIGGLGYGYYTLYGDVEDLKESAARVDREYVVSTYSETDSPSMPVAEVTPAGDDSYYYSDCVDCDEAINNLISGAIVNLPSSKTVTITESVSTPKSQQTSYVPFGTTATSTSTDWYTIDDASAFIDLKNDFSDTAYVTFEASLKVLQGNGGAMARLWDDTNKIAVNGSEITTSSNSEYQLVKSGRIYLWNGNNNYKVQLKSLNGYEVTYTNGKVKVVY